MFSTEIFIDNLSPNIRGRISILQNLISPYDGACVREGSASGWTHSGSQQSVPKYITIDASQGNAKYSLETIQPEASYALMIIKV